MKGVIFYTQSETKSIWADPSAWINTLEKLGVDFYIMIDEEKIVPNWEETKQIEGHRVDTFTGALTKLNEIHPECETVSFDMDAKIELKDFTHPTNVCYVLGADNGENPIFIPDHKIKLYAQNLWAIQCISITFYDSFTKGD